MHAYLSQVKFTNDQMCGRCVERDKKKNVLSPTLDANQIWQKQVEVEDGEEAVGRPTRGSKTLAAMEMGRASAERGRGRRERSGRRRRRGAGEKVGQPDDVGRKKRAHNTFSPMRPCFYTQDDL